MNRACHDKGMNIIVTGGHTGIGFALVQRLVADGHNVGIIVRAAKRAEAVQAAVAPAKLSIFQADLASQEAVLAVADEIMDRWSQVDILFNNAGVLLGDLQWSPQKNEMHYEVNTLAPLLLTQALKPALKRAQNPAVINTSTDPVASATSIDYDTLHKPTKIVKLFGSYVVSKVAVAAAMEAMARSPSWSEVRIFNVAPGAIKTSMTAGDGMPFWLRPIRNLLFKSPEQGADRLYEPALAPKEAYDSPSLIIGGKVRSMKFRLDSEALGQVVAGLRDPDAFVQSVS